ncbi:hypothetical protein GCM10015535_61100 [Streptomyces gelaticus]|uniref:Uncharacterized protein n=1 Tax=Streptomyces gelaticus TaxID=285446 RepID=A0ABQ2W7F6_9ACTN|nr:hypothetical protein GCM10015535_61100 [Streptomyces gelaticus]
MTRWKRAERRSPATMMRGAGREAGSIRPLYGSILCVGHACEEGLAEQFPRDGTLLFFYFDGQADEDAFVSPDDPETWAGAQVLYVPENRARAARRPVDEVLEATAVAVGRGDDKPASSARS